MRAAIDLLTLRLFSRASTLLGVGLIATNCSPGVERFHDNPFAANTLRPPSETTGSVSRSQVQPDPLPALQQTHEPLPAAKPRSELPPGGTPTSAPAMLPKQTARKSVKWLPAPPEGMRSVPPDFLATTEKDDQPR
jgi:hypothetical protein